MQKPKITAYLKQIESGQMKSDAARVLDFIIKNKGSNIIHMKSLLNIRHQTLTARLSELEDLGVIYVAETLNNGTHSKFMYQPDVEKQKLYARNRKFIKFLRWKKTGYTNFKEFLNMELIIGLNT